MPASILLYLVAFAGYAAAALVEWRALALPDTRARMLLGAERFALPVVFLVHGALIVRAVLAPEGLDLSLSNALSAVACVAAVIAWLGGFTRSMSGVAAILL